MIKRSLTTVNPGHTYTISNVNIVKLSVLTKSIIYEVTQNSPDLSMGIEVLIK